MVAQHWPATLLEESFFAFRAEKRSFAATPTAQKNDL